MCECLCVWVRVWQIISNSSGSLAADTVFVISATLSMGCGSGEVALSSVAWK